MAWVWFSVGAENLAKAALVCNGKLERKKRNLGFRFYLPETDGLEWMDEVLNREQQQFGQEEAYNYDYKSLGQLVSRLGKLGQIKEPEKKRLMVAYKYLTAVIRNRTSTPTLRACAGRIFPPSRGCLCQRSTHCSRRWTPMSTLWRSEPRPPTRPKPYSSRPAVFVI
jgi:hypothetical protein